MGCGERPVQWRHCDRGAWQRIPFTVRCRCRVVSVRHVVWPSVPAAQQFHVVSNHLGPPVFLPVLVVPTSCMQPSFHIDLFAFLHHLLADLGQLIEGHDREPLRFLSLLPVLSWTEFATGRDAELHHGPTIRQFPSLRVPTHVADDHDLIETAHR